MDIDHAPVAPEYTPVRSPDDDLEDYTHGAPEESGHGESGSPKTSTRNAKGECLSAVNRAIAVTQNLNDLQRNLTNRQVGQIAQSKKNCTTATANRIREDMVKKSIAMGPKTHVVGVVGLGHDARSKYCHERSCRCHSDSRGRGDITDRTVSTASELTAGMTGTQGVRTPTIEGPDK